MLNSRASTSRLTSIHPVAEASVAVAEARALATTVSLDTGSRLFELAGTAATLDGLGLDRFWRNARTHTWHDPVRWKYHAVGNFYLNGTLPPPARRLVMVHRARRSSA